MKQLLIVLLAGVVWAGVGVKPPMEATPKLPAGIQLVDWKQIKAEYQRHRHAFFPAAEGGYTARAWEQQWLATFDGRGFTIQPQEGNFKWGLELASYGRAGREIAVKAGKPTANLERFSYHHSDALTEWFINDQRGLEHGFTLRERPAGTGELMLTLGVRGGLKPRVSADLVEFVDAADKARMRYSALTVLDAKGQRVPARFQAQESMVRIVMDDAVAQYPITVDPIAQQAYLKTSNTGAGDQFGHSVAASGDTVVVGAYGDNSSSSGVNSTPNDAAPASGGAYVFVRSGSTWSQQAYLKASNTGTDSGFGGSTAASGDTVVVGARGESSSTTGVNSRPNQSAMRSGAAYVFVRNGTTWSQQAYLKASNTSPEAGFGSVAVSGDTVVVGAYGESSGGSLSGAAYVFERSGTTWSQQAFLKAPNIGSGHFFGSSVAASGSTLVVGAVRGEAAYVFVRAGTNWSLQGYLKPSNTSNTTTQFGNSVSVSGNTVVVGANFESSSSSGVNSVPNESAITPVRRTSSSAAEPSGGSSLT